LKKYEGPLLALAAAVFFGGTTAAAKALLGEVRPFMLAGLLYLGAGIGLSLVFFTRGVIHGGERPSVSLNRQDLPWLAGAVAAGGIIAPLLLMWGLQRTPASTVSLLLNLEGVLTVLIAWMVFRENIGSRVLLGLLAVVTGAAVLSIEPAGSTGEGLIGRIAIIGACLGWAVDNNLTRRISAGDPSVIAGIKGLFAGTVNVSIALALGQPIPGAGASALSGLVGFIGYGASLVMFVLALRMMGAARTGALFSTGPFIGAIAAIVILGEHARPVLIPAAMLMGAGLWLQLGERHHHEHVHDYLEHSHAHSHDDHHDHDHESEAEPEKSHHHVHAHKKMTHSHHHYPDIHHRHHH
jgi:drug/metabolite transporter (DMT)-like permease